MGDTVDRAAMKTAADQIDTAASDIGSAKTTLADQVRGLVGSGWKGRAATAFLGSFDAFDDEMDKVQKSLSEIHGKLVDSKMSYDITEDDNEALAAEIDALIQS